jgi:hypothetical protein
MKAKIKTFNIIAICLVVFQLFGYLGNAGKKPAEGNAGDDIAYNIGFNIFFITAIILFIITFFLRRKLKRNEKEDMIDSIGKE